MKKYGILGFPAKHSLSPAVHNAAFKKLKINAKFEIFEVEGKGLKSFFEKVREEPIYGLSVTAPYKETVIDYLDEIDEDARRIGAVNTVVNRDGVLLGYNTDFIGSNMALMEAMPEVPTGDNSVSVVFGAGGAARAVCYGLLKMGTNVWVVNRHKEKADQIAIEFAEMFEAEIHSGEWKELGTGDILVNTTSMWLNKDPYLKKLPSFCAESYVKEFQAVMDITYKPLITPLIDAAQKMGVVTVTGERMFINQAFEQFKLWTGKNAPEPEMQKAMLNNWV